MDRAKSFKEDEVIRFIKAVALQQRLIVKIRLFGSRARGNADVKSDYDFAVEAPDLDDAAWSKWALDVRDDVPTLCGVDLVRVTNSLSQDLRTKIEKEGIDIYVKKPE